DPTGAGAVMTREGEASDQRLDSVGPARHRRVDAPPLDLNRSALPPWWYVRESVLAHFATGGLRWRRSPAPCRPCDCWAMAAWTSSCTPVRRAPPTRHRG